MAVKVAVRWPWVKISTHEFELLPTKDGSILGFSMFFLLKIRWLVFLRSDLHSLGAASTDCKELPPAIAWVHRYTLPLTAWQSTRCPRARDNSEPFCRRPLAIHFGYPVYFDRYIDVDRYMDLRVLPIQQKQEDKKERMHKQILRRINHHGYIQWFPSCWQVISYDGSWGFPNWAAMHNCGYGW